MDQTALLVASGVAFLALVSIGLAFRANSRVYKLESSLEKKVDALSHELNALSHASIGVGRHTSKLEKDIIEVKSSIEEIHYNDPQKVSYSEAGRLVELGASVEDLMNTCGISRPEAELIEALTKSQKGLRSAKAANSEEQLEPPLLTVSA